MALTIARLAMGGGELAISPMPGRGGTYDADLLVLLAFGPSLVISMTPLEEMRSWEAERLGADLKDHEISWRHLPIADFGAPGDEVRRAWPAVAKEAKAVLARGERVLAHCMGGCGRSGMVVLRLMVEAGETPEAALQRLRAVRPCAVETDDQFAWAAEAANERER